MTGSVARGTVAGILVLTGVGFGVFGLWGLWHFVTTGKILIAFGFPTYGDGPFSERGIPTTAPLLAGFIVLCAFETLAGVRVWQGHRDGGVLAVVLLPFEAAYWWGFALPFGPILAVVRSLILLGWWRSIF